MNISYMQSPATGIWKVPNFQTISAEHPAKTEQEKRVETRKETAKVLAKNENNITTETDRLNLKIETANEKAHKEVANRQLYEAEQQLILSQARPFVGKSLSGAEEFVGYGAPGYSTLMFADDASKHASLVGSALRNGQYDSALGNAIKIPADIAMGVVSLFPFTGIGVKTATNTELLQQQIINKVDKLINKSLLFDKPSSILEDVDLSSKDFYKNLLPDDFVDTSGNAPNAWRDFVRLQPEEWKTNGAFHIDHIDNSVAKDGILKDGHGRGELWWDIAPNHRLGLIGSHAPYHDNVIYRVPGKATEPMKTIYNGELRYWPNYRITSNIQLTPDVEMYVYNGNNWALRSSFKSGGKFNYLNYIK